MSLLKRLEKVRARPEHERRQLAFWFSAVITVFVAIIWVVSLSFTLRTNSSAGTNLAGVAISDEATAVATSTVKKTNWLDDNKTRIIEGWKVITN